MVNYNTKKASFTIIELIITVTFIMLFTSFSIGAYNQFSEQKKLEAATRKLSTVLELARAKTIAGDASLCGIQSGTPKVVSYSVDVVNGGEFKMTPHCLTGTPTPIFYLTNMSTKEDHVLFSNDTTTVSFNTLTGNSECSYLHLKNSVLNGGSGSCRYVKVSRTGLTSEDACNTCDTCLAPSPGVDECP